MLNERVFDNLTKGFWAINFDLDTKKVKEIHPNHSLQEAYEELKEFFIGKDFEHRQGSGYVSKDMYSTVELKVIILDLGERYPYANSYIRHMDATLVIPKYIFDCKEILDKTNGEVVKYTGELENFIPQPKVEEKPEEIAHDLKLVLMESEEDEKRQNELLDNATIHTQEAIVRTTPTTEVANNEEKTKVVKKRHMKL